MNRLTRFVVALCPSVPPALRAWCLAAAEDRTMTPAPSVCGEAALGAGATPEGEDPVPTSDPRVSARAPLSPSGPPLVEMSQSEAIHPSLGFLLEDRNLAALVTLWSREQHA